MTSKKEKEVLLNLIEKYKTMPYLWERNHKDYMDVDLRDKGFKALIKIYRQFDETATVKYLKKKIENMRTGFAREYKKVIESQHSGPENIYVPTLYYFDALQFLGEHTDMRMPPRPTDNSEIEGPSSQFSSDGENDYQKPSVSSTQKKRRLSPPNIMVYSQSQDCSPGMAELQYIRDDKWDAIGRAISLQLRDLEKSQRPVAHKLINDILYYGERELLTHHCTISVEDNTIRHSLLEFEAEQQDTKEHILTIHDPLNSDDNM